MSDTSTIGERPARWFNIDAGVKNDAMQAAADEFELSDGQRAELYSHTRWSMVEAHRMAVEMCRRAILDHV